MNFAAREDDAPLDEVLSIAGEVAGRARLWVQATDIAAALGELDASLADFRLRLLQAWRRGAEAVLEDLEEHHPRPATAPEPCAQCRKAKAYRACSGCRTVAYCNETCQRQHWTAGHKRACSREFLLLPRDFARPAANQS